jgi:hypothetical protein
MGSLVEELKLREAPAQAEADELLRSRVEELARDLARAEEQVSRLVIAREEVMRVLEEPAGAELPGGQAAAREGTRAGFADRAVTRDTALVVFMQLEVA